MNPMFHAKTDSTRHLPDESGISTLGEAPLIIVKTPGGGYRHYPVRKPRVVIGSGADCDLKIDDGFVSRRHALIEFTGGAWRLSDLDSTNGTRLNGAKVRELILGERREIRVGRTLLAICPRHSGETRESQQGVKLIGSSLALSRLSERIRRAAAKDFTTLVLGPTGSGKEMVAKVLHDSSERRGRPFVTVNCGAITTTLAESELFGHEKGAFTGAEQRREGVFEQAGSGTVLLDEIGELALETQAKLLRVLEARIVRRIGGARDITLEARVIAATHRDLFGMVGKGLFREDLFYRLYVLPLRVPPLSERKEDIPELTTWFLQEAQQKHVIPTDEALAKLKEHDWPGNVRELKNVILRAVAFCRDETLRAGDIQFVTRENESYLPTTAVSCATEEAAAPRFVRTSFVESKKLWEANRIREALDHTGYNKQAAARMLNMGRSTIFRKIKDLDLSGK